MCLQNINMIVWKNSLRCCILFTFSQICYTLGLIKIKSNSFLIYYNNLLIQNLPFCIIFIITVVFHGVNNIYSKALAKENKITTFWSIWPNCKLCLVLSTAIAGYLFSYDQNHFCCFFSTIKIKLNHRTT